MVFKVIIKKLILVVLSVLFFALGIIGSRFYTNKCVPHIRKHKFLGKIDSLARKIVEGG